MTELLEISKILIRKVSLDFSRYLLEKINWENRLIGIKGARGTGKTTLILQWLKKNHLDQNYAAYFSADDLYFSTNSLVETARNFYNTGGKIIVFDEIHKYKNWSREIKIIYDRYTDLQIIITGSSIIDISKQESDLSRRAVFYELSGLSYREYLTLNKILKISPISLKEITSSGFNTQEYIPNDFRPLQYFNDYLSHGYYPFFSGDTLSYHTQLRQLNRLIVEFDMAELKGFDIRNAKKMLQLISIISQQVPFKPNLNNLAQNSHIHRNSLSNYLLFLQEARLIRLLHPSGISVSTLQKPEKIYMDNTNMMYSLAYNNVNMGALRETFVLSQLAVDHRVNQPQSGDFEIDQKYIFEIGGKKKTRKQIYDLPNSYVVRDDMEHNISNIIPIWLLGFIY
jgi:predicted AAA+ superfamily ATPase